MGGVSYLEVHEKEEVGGMDRHRNDKNSSRWNEVHWTFEEVRD